MKKVAKCILVWGIISMPLKAGIFPEDNELPSKKFQEENFKKEEIFEELNNRNEINQDDIYKAFDNEPDPEGGEGDVTGGGGGVGTRPLPVTDSLYFLFSGACLYMVYLKKKKKTKKR